MANFLDSILNFLSPRLTSILRKITPEISASQMGMSPFISRGGHIVLTAILILFTVSSATWEFFKFFTRPDIVQFSKQSAVELDPVMVQVAVYCSNPPNCGDITLNQNFSSPAILANFPQCKNLESRFVTIAALDTAQNSSVTRVFTVPICFAGDPIYEVATKLPFQLPGITVEFSKVNPGDVDSSLKAYGVVEVTSYPGGMPIRSVTLDSWQVKSLVLSQNVVRKYGDLMERTVFADATQYEGKRPSWRASLLIQSSRFVDVEVTTQSTNMQAVWIVTGTCGLLFQYSLLCSLLNAVLRKIFPGEAQKAAEEFERNGTIEGSAVSNAAMKNKMFTAADSASSPSASPSRDNAGEVISYKVMD